MRGCVLAVVWLALAGGCEKAKSNTAEAEQRPASLVADITRGSVSATDGLRQFAGGINPLFAVGLDDSQILQTLTEITGLASLDGIDRDAPIHILIIDTQAAKGVAVLAKIKDPKLLDSNKGTATVETRNGWVVIGHEPVVKQIASYALGTLVTAPSSAKPAATIYLSQLAANHSGDFQALRDRMTAKGDPKLANMMNAYFDGLLAFATDTDELHATLDASADQAAIDLSFVPKAGSKLAGFVAAQAPSDFAILDKLPETAAPILFGGHLTLGPYHDALVKMMAQFYGGSGDALVAEIGAIMNDATGDVAFAMTMSAAGMEMVQLAGLNDPKIADGIVAKIQTALADGKTIAIATTKVTYKSVPGTTNHAGVTLRGFDTIYDATSAAQEPMVARITPSGALHAEIAAFDQYLVNAAGPHAADVAAHAIDAARGKGPHFTPSPEAAALIANARTHNASLAVIFDVTVFKGMITGAPTTTSAPMLFTLGTADGHAIMRFVVPTASARALMAR